MRRRGRPPTPGLLTPREQEVLDYIRAGLTNADIGDRLGISIETVKQHVSQVLSKLDVTTREEAAAWQPGTAQRWSFGRIVLAIGGTAVVVAALAGLALLAWGLLRSDASNETASRVTPAATLATSGPPVATFRTSIPTFGPTVTSRPRLAGDVQYLPGFYQVDPNGGEPERIYDKSYYSNRGGRMISVSPDGRWLAAPISAPTQYGLSSVVVIDLERQEPPREVEFGDYVFYIALSPNAEKLAAFSRVDDVEGLYVRDLLTGDTATIDAPSGVSRLSWSPDGTTLAFNQTPGGGTFSTLDLWNADDGQLRTLSTPGQDPSWSPDGNSIVVYGSYGGGDAGIWLLDAASGARRTLATYSPYPQETPVWSPDGKWLAFSASPDGNPQAMELHLINVDTGADSVVGTGMQVAWSGDGSMLAYQRDGNVFASNADGTNERLMTQARQPFSESAVWTPGGQLVFAYAPPFTTGVFVANADGSDEVRIAEGRAPIWSPAGDRIVFEGWTTGSGLGGTNEIYTMRPDGGEMRRVGSYSWGDIGGGCRGGTSSQPWAPDGQSVLYGSQSVGGAWLASVDGASSREISDGCNPVYSPTADAIATSNLCPGGGCVSIVDSSGGQVRTFGGSASSDSYYTTPAWSPDGSTLAVDNDTKLTLLNVETGMSRELADIGLRGFFAPAWSPDGAWIAATTWDNNAMIGGNVAVNTTDGSMHQLGPGIVAGWSPNNEAVLQRQDSTTFASSLIFVDPVTGEQTRTLAGESISWSPDGSRIVFAR